MKLKLELDQYYKALIKKKKKRKRKPIASSLNDVGWREKGKENYRKRILIKTEEKLTEYLSELLSLKTLSLSYSIIKGYLTTWSRPP